MVTYGLLACTKPGINKYVKFNCDNAEIYMKHIRQIDILKY